MPAVHRLPQHLKKYVVRQDYNRYTARDQAAWRYIMRQSREFFRLHALPIYVEGLARTAISHDSIPRIEAMDEALGKFGWGAVAVRGFIPPAAFIELQSLKILPIAADMRTVEHISYTPAPDIVHEAAGHAPIIADAEYAQYLTSYAALAKKAIYSKEDIQLYEAIRALSDLKENPDTGPGEIAAAQQTLDAAIKAARYVSEATKVARMYWWTVEYGLMGDLHKPHIYGAGLLSSVAESRHCLTDKVTKLPLSLQCTETSYDITEPQPQLFVARDFSNLRQVLHELEETLAFYRGGIYGLQQAQLAQATTTVELDSGLQITGVVEHHECSEERVEFVKESGPVQLAYRGRQLPGHGTSRHMHGFSSPLGRWKSQPTLAVTAITDAQMVACGVVEGKRVKLEYTSGFIVDGHLMGSTRGDDGRLLLLTFADCTVSKGASVYYQPQWGEFDLAVGETIRSVFGGPADGAAFEEQYIGEATTQPGRQTPYRIEELTLFGLYQQVRDVRRDYSVQNVGVTWEIWQQLATQTLDQFPQEWLLQLELVELYADIKKTTAKASEPEQFKLIKDKLLASMSRLAAKDDVLRSLVTHGLHLLEDAD